MHQPTVSLQNGGEQVGHNFPGSHVPDLFPGTYGPDTDWNCMLMGLYLAAASIGQDALTQQ